MRRFCTSSLDWQFDSKNANFPDQSEFLSFWICDEDEIPPRSPPSHPSSLAAKLKQFSSQDDLGRH